MKLSKDPVPSAKAASAQQQSSRATTNAFRHFGTSHDWREENLFFITNYFYVILIRPARQKYVYFLCFFDAVRCAKSTALGKSKLWVG
jgi:hypothetical protein